MIRNAKQIHRILVRDAKGIGDRCFVCLIFQIDNDLLNIDFFESFIIEDRIAFDIPTLDKSSIQAQVKFASYDYTKNYFVLIGYQAQKDKAYFTTHAVIPFSKPSFLANAILLFFKELAKEFPRLRIEI